MSANEEITKRLQQSDKHHQHSITELSNKLDAFIATQASKHAYSPPQPHAPLQRAHSADARPTSNVDPTMVRVSAKNIVGRDAVAKLVQQLADEANLEFEDYELRPRIAENSQYRIHFLGAAGTAKTKASQFLASLRRNDGTYKATDIPSPRGGTEHLFFNPDRSKTDIAKSRNIKILANIIAGQQPGKTFTTLPRQASITHDWVPIVELKLGDHFSTPVWSTAATDAGLQTDALDVEFAAAIARFHKPE